MALFNLVDKNKLLKKLSFLCTTLGYPSPAELVQAGRKNAEEIKASASIMTENANMNWADAQKEHDMACQAADLKLATAQSQISTIYEKAKSLNSKADEIMSAVDFLCEP